MFGTHPGEQLAGYQGERRLEALFLSLTCRGLFVFFFADISLFQGFIVCVFFLLVGKCAIPTCLCPLTVL